MDEIQAAVLRVKLPRLDGWNGRRREIATRYSTEIENPRVRCPRDLGENYVAHLYVIRAADRDRLREHLAVKGVPTDIHYPVPDHRQMAIADVFAGIANPVAEAACNEVVTLPCFPEMTEDEVSFVIAAVNSW